MYTFNSRKNKLRIALLTLFLIQGCLRPFNFEMFDNGRKSFYTRDYYWDCPRFPLIEPFEIYKLPIGGWSINIGELESDDIISGEEYRPVDLVYCENDIIYCHVLENIKGHNPHIPELSYPERWFIVNLKNMTITNYDGEKSFRTAIGDSIYSLLQSPDTLYAHFCDDIWALPWIPDTVNIE